MYGLTGLKTCASLNHHKASRLIDGVARLVCFVCNVVKSHIQCIGPLRTEIDTHGQVVVRGTTIGSRGSTVETNSEVSD